MVGTRYGGYQSMIRAGPLSTLWRLSKLVTGWGGGHLEIHADMATPTIQVFAIIECYICDVW